MNIEKLNNLFHIYGYELKEEKSTYRVYLLHHGMWKSHTNLTHPGKYFRPSKTIYY